MKKLLAAATAALGLFSASLLLPAAAQADGGYASTKAYAKPFSFQGFYVGSHAGIVSGETTGDPGLPAGLFSTDFNLAGAMAGGQIGYNWQTGNTVLGVEGTYSYSTVQGDTTCVLILNCKREIDWVATAVGRLGMVYGRTLSYGFAGVAWADVNTDISIVGVNILSGSATHVGWTTGFGFEHAFTNGISGKIEYAHIDLGEKNTSLAGGLIQDRVGVTMDTVRLGINIKLSN